MYYPVLYQQVTAITSNMTSYYIILAFDMRVTPTADEKAIENMISGWLQQCNGSIEWLQNNPIIPPTSTEPTNPWFEAFTNACHEL